MSDDDVRRMERASFGWRVAAFITLAIALFVNALGGVGAIGIAFLGAALGAIGARTQGRIEGYREARKETEPASQRLERLARLLRECHVARNFNEPWIAHPEAGGNLAPGKAEYDQADFLLELLEQPNPSKTHRGGRP